MQHYWFLVAGVAVVACGLVAVLLRPPSDRPVSRARCEQVRVGMTLDEVEAILGGPPGAYQTDVVKVYATEIEIGFHGTLVREELWQGDEGVFWVGFDTKDRVVACQFASGGRLTFIDKLRDWLGF